jgi:uncharacterized protein
MPKTWRSALFAASVAAVLAAGPAEADEVRIMTGPQGGVWVPLGGQLKDMWERASPGLRVLSMPGGGIANVRGIEEGKAEIGFGNSISTADAVLGNAPFQKKHENVCNVATLYPQYFQVVVRADAGINSIKDIKGKALTTQQRGNTAELITQQLLKVHGLSYSDIKVSFVGYTDSVTQMQDGHAQVFTLGTTIPSGAVMDLAAGRDVKLLDLADSIDGMKKLNPGYTLVTVPADTYPKQNEPVKVIGYATHIVASCKLPEDIVYAMTKSMAQNVASMAAVNKAITGLTPNGMAQDIGVPFHRGAAKFYKEAGIEVKM